MKKSTLENIGRIIDITYTLCRGRKVGKGVAKINKGSQVHQNWYLLPKNRLIENKIKRFFYAFLHFKISFLCSFHLQEIEILFVFFQSFKAEPLHFGFYMPEFSHSVGFVRVRYSFLIRRFKSF